MSSTSHHFPPNPAERGRQLINATPHMRPNFAERQARFLKRMEFLDTAYYFSRTGITEDQAHVHYLREGQRDGIQPNRWFDPHWYCGVNNLNNEAAQNPARHFLDHGWKQGLDPSPIFSTTGYQMEHPDVADAGINPLLHFLRFGRRERRKVIHPTFLRTPESDAAVIPLLRLADVNIDDIGVAAKNGPEILGRYISALNDRHIQIEVAFVSEANPEIGRRFKERTRHQVMKGVATLAVRHLGLDWARLELWVHTSPIATVEIRTEELAQVLDTLTHRSITCTDCRGFTNAHLLPDWLLNEVRRDNDYITLWVHDFFMVSPSHTLLGRFGRFDTKVPLNTTDPGHIYRSNEGTFISLETWQNTWGHLVEQAHHIIFEMAGQTDQSPMGTFHETYPVSVSKTSMADTAPPLLSELLPVQPPDNTLVIGFLGDLSFEGGADVIMGIAEHLDRTSEGHIIMTGLGYTNIEWGEEDIVAHSHYDPAHVTTIALHHEITCWINPTLWPSPYCDATREALATGLPVFGFETGAQAQPLFEVANGHILQSKPRDAEGIIREIKSVLKSWDNTIFTY